MNPYIKCPEVKKDNFTFRLIKMSDSESLFKCYNDKKAVEFMNDDNCDFGFFMESKEKMTETIGYWLDFYKKQCFIRFAIVDNSIGEAVGTVEGFGGETRVLRIDINISYEKSLYLNEVISFAKENFKEFFGNKYLVTKAVKDDKERCKALENSGFEFIGTFRDYNDYYKISL